MNEPTGEVQRSERSPAELQSELLQTYEALHIRNVRALQTIDDFQSFLSGISQKQNSEYLARLTTKFNTLIDKAKLTPSAKIFLKSNFKDLTISGRQESPSSPSTSGEQTVLLAIRPNNDNAQSSIFSGEAAKSIEENLYDRFHEQFVDSVGSHLAEGIPVDETLLHESREEYVDVSIADPITSKRFLEKWEHDFEEKYGERPHKQ